MAMWFKAVACIIAVAVLLVKCCQAWTTEAEKKKLAAMLEDRWLKAVYTPSVALIINGPVLALHELFDLILGTKAIFSRRAFFRCAILGNAALISAVAISGTMTNLPWPWPWQFYDVGMATIPITKKMMEDQLVAYGRLGGAVDSTGPRTAASTAPTTAPTTSPVLIPVVGPTSSPEQIKKGVAICREELGFCQFFLDHDGIVQKIAYSTIFILVVLSVTSLLTFICVAFSRQALRDLRDAKSYLTFLAVFLFNGTASVVVAMIAIVVLFVVGSPGFWPLCWLAIRAAWLAGSVKLAAGGVLFGTPTLALIGWFFGHPALKIEVIVAIFPLLAVFVVVAWAVLAFPVAKQLHQFVCRGLLLAAEANTKAFAFLITVLAIVATIIAAIAQILP